MRLIDADTLEEHKFVGIKFVQIGGRTNGKTLESINKAYQQGWNDCIDAIMDNAPTIKTFTLLDIEEQYRKGLEKGLSEWETERPQGKWVFRQGVTCGGYYKCNKCGEVERAEKNFCSNCGAEMRKGGKE